MIVSCGWGNAMNRPKRAQIARIPLGRPLDAGLDGPLLLRSAQAGFGL